ncbi:hypothetical protein ACFO1B_50980 [Dactylosporangium siamense]|uniref:Uncharacterized protein n=1 Tax=Dactylosporangium siamense TaxID=685454 RepID=A0A919Q1B3_9ACTN|nr:hypothetical protein [Dactylosporangium siamense]GIG52398.1 hypothetical protein Dsi01nite_104390 [Dactylosporangium siamense]
MTAVPGFREHLEVHIENEGQLLSYMFFMLDVAPATIASYLGDEDEPDWRLTLAFLEDRLALEHVEDGFLVNTAFLPYLPGPQQPGYGIVAELGPLLKERFAVVRPAG